MVDLDSPTASSPKDLWILWICRGPDIHLVLPQESGSCRHPPPELTAQVWRALKKKIKCSLFVAFIQPSYFTLPRSQVQEVGRKNSSNNSVFWIFSPTACTSDKTDSSHFVFPNAAAAARAFCVTGRKTNVELLDFWSNCLLYSELHWEIKPLSLGKGRGREREKTPKEQRCQLCWMQFHLLASCNRNSKALSLSVVQLFFGVFAGFVCFLTYEAKKKKLSATIFERYLKNKGFLISG